MKNRIIDPKLSGIIQAREISRNRLKYYTILIFSILSSLSLLSYGGYNLLNGSTLIGGLEILVALIVAFLAYRQIWLRNDLRLTLVFLIIISFVLVAYFLVTGGINDTGIYWILIIPPFYFFSLGRKGGLISLAALFLIGIIVYFSQLAGLITTPYTGTNYLIMIFVVLFQSAFTYMFEYVRERQINQIRELRALLPICSNCKKIRDDSGYWEQLEEYMDTNLGVGFSHGICPDCIRELYPEYADLDK